MTDLLAATAELIAIASVSHDEAAIADHVDERLRAVPWLSVERVGANVVARTHLGRPQRLVLAGHLDTVPPAESVPGGATSRPRLDGDTLWGLGAADMKGGLAVMIELAAGVAEPAVDLTFAFYAGEEVARVHNGLLAVAAARPDLLAGDAAVLGEPTCARVEAGCQGVLKLAVTLAGHRAHSARPWTGVNAIHRLAPLLDAVRAFPDRTPLIAGCRYRESLQAVAVEGGVAANVVPDTVTLTLNHRFAPDRDAPGAEAALRSLLAPVLEAGDRLEVVDSSPPAPPGLDHPLLAELVTATGSPPRAKLGWTDVAFFAERAIPAVNFGPGDPELAHSAAERVERAQLEAALFALRRVIMAP
ncbi:MAG TPA: succinyl-diaminopimelate desuccinylase [Acidimicrobiales bacterium]|jgi:succinyl-diaminopimelate desuccinylase|nr:succinyl-diaminopimelate desuccinylase [Acidimicrobiales bacterium]